MRCLGIVLGVIIIIGGFTLLYFVTTSTEADDNVNPLKNVLTSTLCDEGEKIKYQHVVVNGDPQDHWYCANHDGGHTREITTKMSLMIGASIIIPFLFGLLLIIASVRSAAESQYIKVTQFPANIDVATFGVDTNQSNLSDRLRQLKDAYENDLISDEEYYKTRKAILDAMDDNL